MSEEQKIHKYIKRYIAKCDGSVPIEYLLQDYKINHMVNLPYEDFGFTSAREFLAATPGITVRESDGETLVEDSVDCSANSSNFQFTSLSVQTKNDLILSSSRDSRVVKVQPSAMTTRAYRNQVSTSKDGDSFKKLNEFFESDGSSRNSSSSNEFSYANYEYSMDTDSTYDLNYEYSLRTYPSYKESLDENHLNYLPYEDVHFRNDQSFPEDESFSFATSSNELPINTSSGWVSPNVFELSRTLSSRSSLNSRNSGKIEDLLLPTNKSSGWASPNPSELSNKSSSNSKNSSQMADFLLPINKSNGWVSPNPFELSNRASSNSRSSGKIDDLFQHQISTENTNWLVEELNKINLSNKTIKVPDSEFVSRVIKLVNEENKSTNVDSNQNTGVDSVTIELKYLKTYLSPLPENWLTILAESNLMYIENLKSKTLIYPTRWFSTALTINSLPPLKYPSSKYWNVEVTSFVDTACVWFRLLDEDYDVKSKTLRYELNKHYKKRSDRMKEETEFEIGHLCAAFLKEEWRRGLITNILGTDVTCLLIDDGIHENFNIADLQTLHEKFTNTPPLSIQGVLSDLEKWEHCNYINFKVLALLQNESEVQVRVDKFLSERKIRVRMNVIKNSEYVDINGITLRIVKQELNLPVLTLNEMYDVVVLSLSELSLAHIQVESPSLILLQTTLEKISRIMKLIDPSKFKVEKISDLKLNNIYLTNYDGEKWRRMICKRFLPNNKIIATFIDHAEERLIDFESIVDTSEFPDVIRFIEPQAMMVKIMDTDAVVLKWMNKFGSPKVFSMKILESEENFAQFFTKLPNGSITPVQNILNMTLNNNLL